MKAKVIEKIPIDLECDFCHQIGTIYLTSPVPLWSIDAKADSEAFRAGWTIRRPPGRGIFQRCPQCTRKGVED